MNPDEIHHQFPSENKFRARFNGIRPDKLKMNFCIICFRDLPESEFPDGRILESCHHKSVICLDCLEESVVEGLDVDLPQVVGCPQCGVTMSANDVWRFSRARISERWAAFLFAATFNVDADHRCIRSEVMLRLTTKQECVICTETLPLSQFPDAGVTESCSHEPNTCLECVSRHFQSQLESRTWDQLRCPECPALLRYADVREYGTEATFQAYDSLTMRHAVSSDPNFRWCTAAGCSSGQVHSDGARSPMIVCNSCRGLSCFTHQSPWHEGVTCLEFDNPDAAENAHQIPIALTSSGFLSKIVNHRKRRMARENRKRFEVMVLAERQEFESRAHECRRELEPSRYERERQIEEARRIRARQQREESATTNLLNSDTKECPGKCGSRIERNGGCAHMTCWVPPSLLSQTIGLITWLTWIIRRFPVPTRVLLVMPRTLETNHATRAFFSPVHLHPSP